MGRNLATDGEDKLDNLPRRLPLHRHGLTGKKGCGCSWCDERHQNNYPPYRHLTRWLKSRAGQAWDKVVSEYVRLPWVPERFRSYSELCQFVEVNTFYNKYGKHAFFASHYFRNQPEQVVEDVFDELLYVHPSRKVLCYKPRNQSRKSWGTQRKRQELNFFRVLGEYNQLIKLNGIWYHVWFAEVDLDRARKHFHADRPLIYDHSSRKFYFHGPLDSYWWTYGLGIPSPYKRQLNHKELIKHGLKNDSTQSFKKCKVCGSLEPCRHTPRDERWWQSI